MNNEIIFYIKEVGFVVVLVLVLVVLVVLVAAVAVVVVVCSFCQVTIKLLRNWARLFKARLS